MLKEAMQNRKPDYDIIIRYLNYWDPTGEFEDCIESGLVPDPYDSYAPRIHKLLQQGINATTLLKEFEMIQTHEMAHQFDIEKANRIAEGLVHCFSENEDRFY
jgi:hypothetical protein